jgi:threonine/homoserine/homoserine lactone efflux protein
VCFIRLLFDARQTRLREIVLVLSYLLQGVGYGFAGAVQPGPFQTYIISQALDKGWRRAWPVALAPLISDGPIIVLVLVVLSQVPAWLVRFLYIAGGLFVLYLAVRAYGKWRSFDAEEEAVTSSSRQQGLWKAAMMNMLSPGPYMFWSLVTGPLFLAGWRESPKYGLGLLFGFYGTMMVTLAGIVVLFATAKRLGPRVTRALLGVSSIALGGFGCYQLWLGLSGAYGA